MDCEFLGRGKDRAFSRRSVTAEVRIQSSISLSEMCSAKIGTGTQFSSSTAILPCHYHLTGTACSFTFCHGPY
jgi:hypothetical protein